MSAGKRDSVTDKALRRAVDDCLLSANPSPESEELLRRYPGYLILPGHGAPLVNPEET